MNNRAERGENEPLIEWLRRLAWDPAITLELAVKEVLHNLDGLTDDEGRRALEAIGLRAAEERHSRYVFNSAEVERERTPVLARLSARIAAN